MILCDVVAVFSHDTCMYMYTDHIDMLRGNVGVYFVFPLLQMMFSDSTRSDKISNQSAPLYCCICRYLPLPSRTNSAHRARL